MKTIYFHGSLKKFGTKFQLEVQDVVQGCRLLCAQIPGLRGVLKEGMYRVVRGRPGKGGFELGPEEIRMALVDEVHIYPVIEGSKKSGAGKIIVGLLLVGITIATAGAGGLVAGSIAAGTASLTLAGQVALFGVALALSGVAQYLAQPQTSDYDSREKEDNSFLFNGVQNTTEQGGSVPVVYGKFLTGSKVISAGIDVEDMHGSYGGSTTTGGLISRLVGVSPDGTYGGGPQIVVERYDVTP